MSILRRLFKIGQSEAHSAVDKLENPIKLTEQGIRDMKNDLNQSLQALAEVKAMTIRMRGDIKNQTEAAKDYENKAMMLMKRAQDKSIDPSEADRLASEALTKKEECIGQAARGKKELETYEKSTAQLQANVNKIKTNISKWENELRTLKARVKVSSTTKKLNKQLAQIDSTSTISMLEKMKDKVAQDEALAESYGDIANESRSLDEEIDSVLEDSSSTGGSDALAELKKKMGMQ
jgi:phage shock protein A